MAGAFDWDDVYRRHAPDLRRLIARQVPSSAAEDVLQETFVRAFRSRARFDPARDEWPWLATLAHRSCVKWWRTHRAAEVPMDEAVDRMAPTAPPGSDEHLLRLEQSRATTTALTQLAPRQRRVLYRQAAEDVPYERIADDEAISPQALKSLLNRARVHFRQHYLRLLDESAGLLVLGRTALARLRARLSEREVVVWERLAPMAGTVLVAGVVGALTMPSGTAPARADTTRIAAVRSIDATTSPTAPSATRTAAEERAVSGRQGREVGSIPRDVPPRADIDGPALGINTGGGLTNGPDTSAAAMWIEVDKTVVGQEVRFGTEVRCDAGKVFTLECTVLRLLPPIN